MNGHDIRLIESLATVRAFSHAIGDSVFYAMIAENMTASLQYSILEIFAADCAQSK